MSSRPPIPHQALSELVALLAHDLRNPLAIALTNVNYARGAVDERQTDLAEALDDAALSCSALERIIANLDVLAVALGDGGSPTRAVALRAVLADAVARLEPHARAVGVTLALADGGVSPLVVGHEDLFARALDNLLANAVQYSRSGQVVEVTLGVDGGHAVVRVRDGGPVVPPQEREEVFAAAAQSRVKLRLETRYGRGLGLFCAAEAAAALGAEVSAGEADGASVLSLRARLAAPGA